MIRIIGAFITVISCMVAGFGYLMLFADEIDPRNPVNKGVGILAPMYRHWVEYPLVIWMAFLIVLVGYYSLMGTKGGIVVNWSVADYWWFRLHIASAIVILFGLFAAFAIGQPLHARDAVTTAIGLGFLAIGVWQRAAAPHAPSSISNFSHR